MKLLLQAKSAYGQVRFYPVNQPAKDLADLTRTSTFTYSMLLIAKRMGAELQLTGDSFQPVSEDDKTQFQQLF